MRAPKPSKNAAELDQVVADARRAADRRNQGYREQALKLYPWVCGRCARTFTRENLHDLTVHHRNHNHDHNPSDGSNWELLCLYCHDNEHARYIDNRSSGATGVKDTTAATSTPFSGLKDLLTRKEE